MSNLPNNVNVMDFDVHDLLWNLEEYHRKSTDKYVIILCNKMISDFHDSNSVLRVFYGDSKLEFRLWTDENDPKYPRYIINVWESIEASRSKGSILMMIVYLWNYETKEPMLKFRGPIYQMRKSLTFNENKALSEWVCGFDEKRSNDEGKG